MTGLGHFYGLTISHSQTVQTTEQLPSKGMLWSIAMQMAHFGRMDTSHKNIATSPGRRSSEQIVVVPQLIPWCYKDLPSFKMKLCKSFPWCKAANPPSWRLFGAVGSSRVQYHPVTLHVLGHAEKSRSKLWCYSWTFEQREPPWGVKELK